uniref:Ras-family member, GTP-binding protein,putative n=1 Tax=Trypanosoma vivax (strain Y486) TaxID=1055687 RepID=G0UAM1_TRYVY|nr:ras-family member, GTP-binding protein,putative, fragment [Trypanosoma vivax Y486]
MRDQIEKLLLMGPAGAGKTCMRSIIFDNYLPRDTLRLGVTISLEQSRVRMLNNLYLNLWDCGGQHRYVTEYLNRQKEFIFRNVCVLLFVFDISSMSHEGSSAHGNTCANWSRVEMLRYFQAAIQCVRSYSPKAKVFVLLHKMDLIAPKLRQNIFESRKAEVIDYVVNSGEVATDIKFLGAGNEDSSVGFCVEGSDSERDDDVLSFSSTESRTTKVSETVKQFKLSCMNNTTSLEGFQITTDTFTALLHPFTSCTYVLMVSEDTSITVELHRINVRGAQRLFEQFLRSEDGVALEMRRML